MGGRDAKRLAPLLGVGMGSAASAAFVEYAVVRMLGLVPQFVSIGPRMSEVRVGRCIYGDAVVRYRHPFVCAMCVEYNRGIAGALGVEFTPGERRISLGGGSCTGRMELSHPSCGQMPSLMRAELVISLMRAASGSNAFLVSTLSSIFAGLGERVLEAVGPEASVLAARGAVEAGKHQGPVFSASLGLSGGLEGAATLLSSVREALGCGVRAGAHVGGFSVSTKKCPHEAFCSDGNFTEAVCASYSGGLLSAIGEFGVVSRRGGGVCRQEFTLRITSPGL